MQRQAFAVGKPNRRQRRAARTRRRNDAPSPADGVAADLKRAVASQRARDFHAAKEIYDRLLKTHRDSVDVLLRIVEFYELQDDFERAFAEAKRAVRLAPNNATAWGVLATCLKTGGEFKPALIAQEKAVELAPDDAVALINLAALRVRLYDTDGALAAITRALELAPDRAAAHLAYGNLLHNLGRFEEARASFRTVLELEPDNLFVYQSLLQSRGLAAEDYEAALRHIEAALKDPELHELKRVSGLFSLAEIHERRKDYDLAFAHFQRANEAVAAVHRFDTENHRRHIDGLIAAFTPATFAALRQAGSPSEVPVFVVGMPRSGTTLVEQILASHAEVFGGGEMNEMEKLEHTLGTNRAGGALRYPEEIASFECEALATVGRQHLAHLGQLSGGAARVVDKLPTNFLRLGLIKVLFPEVRVIHCRRDPMDTCWSCYSKDFLRKKQLIMTFDLAWLAAFYREYERLMAHWHTVMPGQILDVQYERLIADPEQVSRRMIAHLGLDWDAACLRFHEQDTSVQTASAWQVRQPIYTTSSQKWRRYETHLEPLRQALGLPA